MSLFASEKRCQVAQAEKESAARAEIKSRLAALVVQEEEAQVQAAAQAAARRELRALAAAAEARAQAAEARAERPQLPRGSGHPACCRDPMERSPYDERHHVASISEALTLQRFER